VQERLGLRKIKVVDGAQQRRQSVRLRSHGVPQQGERRVIALAVAAGRAARWHPLVAR
jgi:hypothetical protein